MPIVIADRVREISGTVGTGTYALVGTDNEPSYRTFRSAIGDGHTTYYFAEDKLGSWEIGIGTVSGATLARTTILSSSNSNSAVNWPTPIKKYIECIAAPASVSREAIGNPYRLVSNNSGYIVGAAADGLSNGVLTGVSALRKHKALSYITSLKVVYGNWSVESTNGEAVPSNNINVKCAIEYPSGTINPVFFGVTRTGVIAPYAMLASEPISLDIAEGDDFWVRTSVTVQAGEKWPLCHSSGGNGVTNQDLVDAGAIAGTTSYLYHEMAVLGIPSKPLASVLLLGDSIISSSSDTADTYGNIGWIARAIGGTLPYVKVSCGGERGTHWAGTTARNKVRRVTLADYAQCTHAIVNYGHNDFSASRTAAQLQTDLATVWAMLVARGMKVFQCTIGPKTTSTDGWATAGNQTSAGVRFTSDRITVNNWIRTVPAPLSGYIEYADYVETSRGSNVWISPGYTADGTHPSTTAHTAATAGVDISVFTL